MSARVWDVGQRSRGDVVRVSLAGGGANVLLVDSTNLGNYKAGRRVSYRGGLVTRSPYDIAVPSSGRWHVIVSTDGLRNSTRASVQVLRGPLPPARSSVTHPLASVRHAADQYVGVSDGPEAERADMRPYDVFVCHASPDKDEIVRPLALALVERGLAVWYDELELRIGSNLRQTIDDGLTRSRFGVVVLSPAFFEQGWRQYELDGLVTLEMSGGRQLILPIWHRVTRADVEKYSPSLAGKLARSTAEHSVTEIADEIADVARS